MINDILTSILCTIVHAFAIACKYIYMRIYTPHICCICAVMRFAPLPTLSATRVIILRSPPSCKRSRKREFGLYFADGMIRSPRATRSLYKMFVYWGRQNSRNYMYICCMLRCSACPMHDGRS